MINLMCSFKISIENFTLEELPTPKKIDSLENSSETWEVELEKTSFLSPESWRYEEYKNAFSKLKNRDGTFTFFCN